ncbi:hypothetical protein Ddye_017209 [Dipteronia dyeriana]|uniref:Phospholipid/glycerol acyltransferase domain-containing protein n=1 Tax=Dipteronia dyeriana TaxID=168575 RepID=A0AAD9U994_9ROSI|nr:hypothetical protein Ddye_017209 [Dipteronia dyeriana]
MSLNVSFFKSLFFYFFRILFRQFTNPKFQHRSTVSNVHATLTHGKYRKYPSLAHKSDVQDDLSTQTLVFDVEGALLKSSSVFPYFMLVAFEAGGLIRAFVLLLSYPILCLVNEEMGSKIMVMVCFFGMKKDNFRVGTAVLPKFFLEDVGFEILQVLQRGGKRVGVSNMPQVMMDSFLRDYLEIEVVVGRDLKVLCGYFIGLMEERKNDNKLGLEEMQLGHQNNNFCDDVIGISSFNNSLDHKLFLQCKEIYLVRRSDKRSWQHLPRDKYPKPLVFHDGRLALRPTPLASLVLFMWLPFAFSLAVFRAFVAIIIPHDISSPILAFTGLRLTVTPPPKTSHSTPSPSPSSKTKMPRQRGLLYVCNHRTLLDPVYLGFALKKNLTAVTYSLSRMSEILAPNKTVRLTRDRDQDGKMMERLLNQGDLVVCPEGTTCREPYLLRFSPLFADMSDNIVPVAVNTYVTMFYGTTASGLKCLDPFIFLMNPSSSYTMEFLHAVSGLYTCPDGENTRFGVANHVQSEIGKALGFECTKLTRRDKYMILAGTEGIACTGNKKS